MELLLEYQGSRRPLTATTEELLATVAHELRLLQVSARPVVRVGLSEDDEAQTYYLLQRWSDKWETYVDVQDVAEVTSGNKITVIRRTAQRPGLLKSLLCCASCQGTTSGKLHRRRRGKIVEDPNEEQEMDYHLTPPPDSTSQASDWPESIVCSETSSISSKDGIPGGTDIGDGQSPAQEAHNYISLMAAMFIRPAGSKRASWMLMPTHLKDKPQKKEAESVGEGSTEGERGGEVSKTGDNDSDQEETPTNECEEP